MAPSRRVAIDFLPQSALRYLDYDALVCLEPMLSTTTLVTSVAQGRKAFPTVNRAEAIALGRRVPEALLAGDGAQRVAGALFEIKNSPSALEARSDHHRPMILAGGCSAQLIQNAARARAVYVACFRNLTATASHLAERYHRVALLGAGSQGSLRCEDQMAAARLASLLFERGFAPERAVADDVVRRWSDVDFSLIHLGTSAEKLRRAGQAEDVDFVVSRTDDTDLVCRYFAADGEPGYVAAVADERPARRFLHAV